MKLLGAIECRGDGEVSNDAGALETGDLHLFQGFELRRGTHAQVHHR